MLARPHFVNAAVKPPRPLSTAAAEPADQRIRTAVLLAGLATAGALAAASMMLSATVVRLALGDDAGALATILIGAGTLAGTWFGSWISQPGITRLVTRLLRSS